MDFGFNKSKKKNKQPAGQSTADMQTQIDKDGNIELVSKNFKMKPTPKQDESQTAGGDSWVCWGCGQVNTEDVCPVCGKRRSK